MFDQENKFLVKKTSL